jgi:hypothetical protein
MWASHAEGRLAISDVSRHTLNQLEVPRFIISAYNEHGENSNTYIGGAPEEMNLGTGRNVFA